MILRPSHLTCDVYLDLTSEAGHGFSRQTEVSRRVVNQTCPNVKSLAITARG